MQEDSVPVHEDILHHPASMNYMYQYDSDGPAPAPIATLFHRFILLFIQILITYGSEQGKCGRTF